MRDKNFSPQRLADYLGGKYLEECTLYVTLEPCVMLWKLLLDTSKENCLWKLQMKKEDFQV